MEDGKITDPALPVISGQDKQGPPRHAKTLLGNFLYVLVACEVVACIVLVYYQQYILVVKNDKMFDVFGRELVPPPIILRAVFEVSGSIYAHVWPGLGWFICDTCLFGVAVLIGYGLISLARSLER
jgi:hypothetical protein